VPTKHLRKTLSPVWNESISCILADGQDVAQKYFKTRKTYAAAAQRLVTLEFQLMNWDPTGNESIGFVNLEVYALMDKIARPGAEALNLVSLCSIDQAQAERECADLTVKPPR